MAYKMKSSGLPFKELGSSPAKQVIGAWSGSGLPHEIDSGKNLSKKDLVKRAIAESKANPPKPSSIETVRTLAETKKPDDTAARQLASKKLNKAFNKRQRIKAIKKVGKKALKVGGRIAGGLGVAQLGYEAYKSGQKHSGGKAVKGQKSFMAESKKKTKSIYKKK